MSQNDLQLAFIGCGGIARRHVVAMRDLYDRGRRSFVVTAVCDAVEESARSLADYLADQLGVRPAVYTDYHKLLAEAKVDGADLCLPHGLHHTVTIDCLEAGVHVLCEKPIGVTIKAGQLMAAAAERTGRILSIAVPHRRQPGQRVAHWLFNQSKLMGEPLTFLHAYTRPPDPVDPHAPIPERVRWRRDRMMSGGGMTLDSGFHYCDSIRYFFGDVEKVYAEMRELKSGRPVPVQERPEDSITVTFSFKSGLVGTWCWSVAAPGEAHAHVAFYGSQGCLLDETDSRFRIFHLFERRPGQREAGRLLRSDGTVHTLAELEALYRQSLSAEESELLFPGGTDDGFAIEIWEFVDLIRGNRLAPEVDAQEGLRSLAIGDAIYESAFTGDVVRVDDILSGRRGAYQAPIDEHWGL
jgi:predicted dehydrogenase